MQAVLRVEGLDYNVGTFSLRLPGASLLPGDRVAICGPSGCGKSTLLGLLALALAPGRAVLLELGGVDAAALWLCGRKDKLTALRRSLIGFVPQTGGLLPFLSIGENMRLQQDMIRGRDPARIAALAHSLGIAALMDRRPGEVSVGQRQRAAIGRALGHKPRLVLADEPTASLHPAQADDMLGLLALSADEGAAVLVATHDPARAREAGFRLIHARVDAERETTEFAFDADADPTA